MVKKAVILAGGLGTRLSEETELKPKPMVEIGDKPILWHIMKILSTHGIQEFIICLGYKGYIIKEYFANYYMHTSNVTFNMRTNTNEMYFHDAEPWRVTLVETGDDTATGGRLKKVKSYIGNEDFCFTYGDGVGNIDITRLIEFHKQEEVLATVTAVRPPSRFGALVRENNKVIRFDEKPIEGTSWINGGFFILSPKVFDYIEGDKTSWEQEPMNQLVTERQLAAFEHSGFWQPMDTLREKKQLQELWAANKAPWKIW